MKKPLLLLISLFIYTFSWSQVLPTDWNGDSGIDTYQSTDAHGGSYSCKVVVNTGSQGSCDFDNTVTIPVVAGNSYTVKFWYKTSDHVKARIHFYWTGATNAFGSYTVAGASSWTEFSQSGTIPSGATKVRIGIRFYDQSGFSAGEEQFIDDVTFESPTGTSLTVTNGDFESWPSGPDNPVNFTATAVSTSEIDLSWALNAAGNDVMVAWSSDGTFGTPVNSTDYSVGDVISGGGTVLYNGNGTSFNHTGLNINTVYYYKAWSVDASTTYSTGVTDNAKTFHGGTKKLPNKWEGDSGIDTYRESSTVHGGNYSCEVTVNTTNQGNCDLTNEEGIAVTPGNTYTFKFWIWSSPHVRGRAAVDFYRSDGSFIETQYGGYNAVSESWDQVQKSGTVPADAATAKVRVRFYDRTGFVIGESQYVDDFTFESPDGNALVVANGNMESWTSTPVIPLSNWSVLISISLILLFSFKFYKKTV